MANPVGKKRAMPIGMALLCGLSVVAVSSGGPGFIKPMLEPNMPKDSDVNNQTIMYAMQVLDKSATVATIRRDVAENALEKKDWYYRLTPQQKDNDQSIIANSSAAYAGYIAAHAYGLAHGPSQQQLNYGFDQLNPMRSKLADLDRANGVSPTGSAPS